MEHIAISHCTELTFGPNQIVNRVYTLQVHGKTFKTVGDFASHRVAFNTTDLLEVSELSYFHTVEPNFPTQAPCTKCWRFPVVFHETNVVYQRVDPNRFKRVKVKLLDVVRVRLKHDLELVVVLQTVWIFTITTVFR